MSLGLAIGGLSMSTGEAQAGPRQNFQMPFPCGQKWQGATYSGHGQGNEGSYALDLNWRSGNSDMGKPVVASLGGTVVRPGYSSTYGNYVYIKHGKGWRTMYAHLRSIRVKKGAKVKAGQRIGAVGNTGNAKTSHLHYEQQRYIADKDGTPFEAVYIHFNGSRMKPGYSHTYNGPTYTSRNCRG